MEKITLKFSITPSLFPANGMVVVLTLDEKGKGYTVKSDNPLGEFAKEISGKQEDLPPIPKRVLDAFTENAIDRILSKDEIPNESGMMVLDGYHYEITITKGDISKVYYANDANIQTYPLLRHLADWCRRL